MLKIRQLFIYKTSVALPGFPGDLEHWLNLRGGNVIQKYLYTPNFSSLAQLDAEIWQYEPNLDQSFFFSKIGDNSIPMDSYWYKVGDKS